jgi:predicted ATP-dependent endonuclease of OLD family
MSTTEQLYISKVSLSGYKTILNIEADFNPGLNIIIGKNGSGKTNFLNFLNSSLKRDFKGLINFKSVIDLREENRGVTIIAKKDVLTKESSRDDFSDYISSDPPEIKFFSNTFNQNNIEQEEIEDINDKRINGLINFNSLFIGHGIRSSTSNKIIDSPFSFSLPYNFNQPSRGDLTNEFVNEQNSYFFRAFCGTMFFSFMENTAQNTAKPKKFKFDENKIRTNITRVFKMVNDSLNSIINSYLPIEKIRLNESFAIYNDDSNSLIKVENIYLEFLLDGNWLPFSSLSDGTKRLFCIYADIISPKFFDYPSIKKIVLLEEPELGIHPHQLQLLMNFLKSVSDEIQIIITTHSPLILDILDINELSALHLCSYSKEAGTQISSLTENQLESAKVYMENESYLSDYWRYSDLDL